MLGTKMRSKPDEDLFFGEPLFLGQKRGPNSDKDPVNLAFPVLPPCPKIVPAHWKIDRKTAKKGRKIAFLSLYLQYLYHV